MILSPELHYRTLPMLVLATDVKARWRRRPSRLGDDKAARPAECGQSLLLGATDSVARAGAGDQIAGDDKAARTRAETGTGPLGAGRARELVEKKS